MTSDDEWPFDNKSGAYAKVAMQKQHDHPPHKTSNLPAEDLRYNYSTADRTTVQVKTLGVLSGIRLLLQKQTFHFTDRSLNVFILSVYGLHN